MRSQLSSKFEPSVTFKGFGDVEASPNYGSVSKEQIANFLRAPLTMHLFRDCGVSAVLQSSGITYTLRLCARCFLALTKQ